MVRARGRVGGGVGRGGTYVGDRARPVFLTSWEMLSRSSAVLVTQGLQRPRLEAAAGATGTAHAALVLEEAAVRVTVGVRAATLPAGVRRRLRRHRHRGSTIAVALGPVRARSKTCWQIQASSNSKQCPGGLFLAPIPLSVSYVSGAIRQTGRRGMGAWRRQPPATPSSKLLLTA